MPVPSNDLVFVVPHTCMNIFYHDNSGLYLGLGRYEGWPVEMFSPDIVFRPKNLVRFARFVT